MPETADKHLLISPLDSIDKGDSWAAGEQLPLHVTVMPWFRNLSIAGLKNVLINHCTTYEPFEVIGGEDEMFGTASDPVRVNKLARVGRLPRIHHDILDLINFRGGQVESDWVGDDYSPHVSYLGEVGLCEGETRTLDRLGLVGKYPDGSKRIELVIPFSGQLRRG